MHHTQQKTITSAIIINRRVCILSNKLRRLYIISLLILENNKNPCHCSMFIKHTLRGKGDHLLKGCKTTYKQCTTERKFVLSSKLNSTIFMIGVIHLDANEFYGVIRPVVRIVSCRQFARACE